MGLSEISGKKEKGKYFHYRISKDRRDESEDQAAGKSNLHNDSVFHLE